VAFAELDDDVQNNEELPTFNVTVASQGEQGVELVWESIEKNSPFAVAIIDIHMPPGIDGLETASKIRDLDSSIYIIIITAYGELSINELQRKVRYNVFLARKPLSKDEIIQQVRNACNCWGRDRQLEIKSLELEQQRDLLQELSIRDGMTGIFNRRYFDEFLNKEWCRARRSEETLSLVMMDIDHFKAYNDNYGHSAGDDCLRRVAQALSETVMRDTDIVARYGGEEFVCVLPGINCDGAIKIGEKQMRRINELAIPHSYSSAADHVTLSLGVASMIPSKRGGCGPNELIKAADKNLYRAKESGRNQLVSDECIQ